MKNLTNFIPSDLEPVSFHKSQPNSILTTHLRTFWTNITKVKLPHFQITEQDQNYFYSLLQKLTIS